MNALEHMVRTFARRTTQNGDVVLITSGHPALVKAFHELGWTDPYPDPELLPKPELKRVLSEPKTATVQSKERAVMPPGKGRLDGGL